MEPSRITEAFRAGPGFGLRNEGTTHEEIIVGACCCRHPGRFDGFAGLCLARRLGSGYRPGSARRRDHRRCDRLQLLSVRLLRSRLRLWAGLLRRRSLRPLLLAASALLGWLWLARPQRAG